MVKKGYKQTEVGLIPEKWTVSTIGAIADVKTGPFGSALHAEDYVQDGTPIITVEHLGETGLTHQNLPKVSEKDRHRLFAYSMQEGDIVFSRVGSVDRNAYVTASENGWLFSGRILRLRAKNEKLSTQYLGYYFKSEDTKERIRNVAVGQTMPSLNTKLMNAFKVVLPTIEEQKDIAALLSNMDTLISALEKQISKKKAIKQGAMQELLTGKRRLPGFSGEWETKKLEDYCSLITKQTGFDYSAYIKPALITRKMPNTFPMIQTINFRGRKFTFETDYYIPQSVAMQFPNIVLNKKCVLFSIVGASVGNVGLYPGSITAFCGGAIGITRFRNEQDAEWVFNYMSSPDGQSQIQYVTKGGAQATVTIADIRNFKIPTPEKDERDAISGILENMDHEIEVLEQKLEKYSEVKQGMMQQLLTGKIRLV